MVFYCDEQNVLSNNGYGLRVDYCNRLFSSLPVNHILIECPQLSHLGITLKDLFSDTSVNNIIVFIRDTRLFNRI